MNAATKPIERNQTLGPRHWFWIAWLTALVLLAVEVVILRYDSSAPLGLDKLELMFDGSSLRILGISTWEFVCNTNNSAELRSAACCYMCAIGAALMSVALIFSAYRRRGENCTQRAAEFISSGILLCAVIYVGLAREQIMWNGENSRLFPFELRDQLVANAVLAHRQNLNEFELDGVRFIKRNPHRFVCNQIPNTQGPLSWQIWEIDVYESDGRAWQAVYAWRHFWRYVFIHCDWTGKSKDLPAEVIAQLGDQSCDVIRWSRIDDRDWFFVQFRTRDQ